MSRILITLGILYFGGYVNCDVQAQTDEIVLFSFDDYSIPFRLGLHLELVSGSKYPGNPVLRNGPPGTPDSRLVIYYGSVIRIGGEFRMWYIGRGDVDRHPRVCYAVSQDGMHWEKPSLGLVEYNGNTNNNLVKLDTDERLYHYPFYDYNKWPVACVVLYEPDDPDPNKRFKMSYEIEFCTRHNVAYSPDGIVWTNSPNNPANKGCDGLELEQSGLTKFNGCYYVYGHDATTGFRRRNLIIHASYDFEHWTEAKVLGFRRDSIPPKPFISGWHTGEQIHLGASVWNRGNVIIGFYGLWHGHRNDDRRFVDMDIGLIVSNDAIHFREPIPDFKIISAAEEPDGTGSLKSSVQPALAQGQGFENVGDKTYVWYSAWYEGMVRLAIWPRDRLGYYTVRLQQTEGQLPVPDTPSHFISRPIRLKKKSRIYLNVDGLSEHANVTVELLDEQFRKLPEYSGANCIEITESGFRQPVKWRDKKFLDMAQPIRIRVNFNGIRPEDIRIYAVYIS